jgi:formylglycine-generating enzyme required for sulfatase activity
MMYRSLLVVLGTLAGCAGGMLSPDEFGDGDGAGAPVSAFVRIEAGTFAMGSAPGEIGRDADEEVHLVTITRPFYLGRMEVTQAEWRDVARNDPSHFRGCEDCPVDSVNFWDALAYLNHISSVAGFAPCYELIGCDGTPGVNFVCETAAYDHATCDGFRLPTEAEWEYATRADTNTAFHNGIMVDERCSDTGLGTIGWYCGNAEERTKSVGSLAANAWGLHDTSGNLWEWVWDRYDAYEGDAADPLGPPAGDIRGVRGGGWYSLARECRSANRGAEEPGYRSGDLGFRVARTEFR